MYAKSPERYDFMINFYKKQLDKNPNNFNAKNLIEQYQKYKEFDEDDISKKDNLEYDLRSCESIIKKCKNSDKYSQNLYAALCNNQFKKINDNLLKTFENVEYWQCSWRHAGGIVADLNERGDYVDWYCSGIGGKEGYFSEGFVTNEIKIDLEKLGWIIINEKK